MTALPRLSVLLLALACAAAHAQLAGDAADQRSRLIAQKLRLVESLIDSPAAQRSAFGREAETPALVLEGKRLLQAARDALAANRYDDAGSALDAALRNAANASARLSSQQPGVLSSSAQQASYGSLLEQVATYRAAFDDIRGPAADEARKTAARIDALRKEAAALADGGRLGDANRKLREAYKHAVETLSRLRAGQTVVLSLDFATPADEYGYERRRFESSEILVGMMIDEGRADGERRVMVDGFLREGQRLRGLAAAQADSGDHRSAIAAMEKAAAQLNRALQAMGLPAF